VTAIVSNDLVITFETHGGIMKRAVAYRLLLVGAVGMIRCGGAESQSALQSGAGGSAGSAATGGSTGAGGSQATGGSTATGGGGGVAGIGGAAGSAGTGGGSPGGVLADAGFNSTTCPNAEPISGGSCTNGGGQGMGFGACNYSNGDICVCGAGMGGGQTWTCLNVGGVLDGGNFAFDAGGFNFDGAIGCPMNQPASGFPCFAGANRTCAYAATSCTCEVPDGAGGVTRWNCQ
jgi:hypothetical protein